MLFTEGLVKLQEECDKKSLYINLDKAEIRVIKCNAVWLLKDTGETKRKRIGGVKTTIEG